MDLATMYRDGQTRTMSLIGSLPEGAGSIIVAGTPAWTVPDLVAHLCGVASDMVTGNLEDVASEAWTARQVVLRRGRTLDDLLAEWTEVTPTLLEMLATTSRVNAVAFDLLTHEHDLRGALGLAGLSDQVAAAAVLGRVTRRLAGKIDEAGLPALRLEADDVSWRCGTGDVGPTGRAPVVEWFRALMGRRSAAQIATYDWDGDPEPYHDLLSLFGPLPTEPVTEAGAPAA